MTASCGFDSADTWKPTNAPQKSDCYQTCTELTAYWCPVAGDGICDEYCNRIECGYDMGDCTYCGTQCKCHLGFQNQLNGSCDPACDNAACYYGENTCRECAVGCNSTIWGDGNCNSECNNPECNYDNGDCLYVACAQGCNIWMIGNSICDQACNVEECMYDKTDCGCSPGCSYSLLGDGICNEECNNLDCEFDGGDCGHCASGCTVRMLSNQVCDPECNTVNCEWDYGVCGCSELCSVDDYGKCKPECLVGECQYDRMSSENWCDNQDLVWFTVYQQINRNDTSSVVRFEDCWEASNHQCNLTMALDQNTCHPECFISECNYGLCHTSSLSDCEANLPLEGQNLCSACTSQGLGFSCSQCLLANPSSSTTLDLFGLSFCYSNATAKTFLHYTAYYISSNDSIGDEADGTINNPYSQYKFPLYGHDRCSPVIFLLIDDGTYLINAWSLYLCNVIFASANQSTPTMLISNWFPETSYFFGNVKFENLIFDGLRNNIFCSGSEYCTYCAYLTLNQSDGYYYTDKGEKFLQYSPLIHCDNQEWQNSYFMCESCTFINVEMRNLRFPMASIISGTGNIILINVTFDNIWVNMDSTAISMTNSSLTASNIFNYIGGSVSRLNNGYEFGDPLDFRGFLYISGPFAVRIENVEFKYNLAYRKPQSTLNQVSLIYIDSFNTFKLSNCTFMYNYFETGLIQIYSSVLESQMALNESSYINYFELDHISIQDSTFKSNYADSNLIYIHYSNTLLNFVLQNSTFELNGAGDGPLIFLDNYAMLDEYKEWTQKQITRPSGLVVNATISPRWCRFQNLNFTRNYAQGMFEANYMANFLIRNITFDANGSPYDNQNINTLVLDHFIGNDDIYTSKNEPSPKSLDCDWLASISGSYSVDISYVSLTGNTCRSSSPTFSISESSTNEVNSIHCDSNYGQGTAPICLYISGGFEMNLTNSAFSRNKNSNSSGSGAIQIKGSPRVSIADCSFFNNTGMFGAAYILECKDLLVSSSTFDSNNSPSGYGASIYSLFSASSDLQLFEVSSSVFSNGLAYYGGAIYMAQVNSQHSISLAFSELTFIGNAASYGAALYLASSVSLSQSSSITDCKFQANSADVSGLMSLYNQGNLELKVCNFTKNSGVKGSAIFISFQNSFSLKLSLDSCTFQSNIGNSVIYSDSPTSSSKILTKYCIFEYNSGSVFYLVFCPLVDNGSIFRHNSATSSCLNLQNSARLELSSTKFLNNTSDLIGGAIALKSKSSLVCNNCSFIANSAKDGYGGAVHAEEDSTVAISYSDFSNNVGSKDGDAIYIFNSKYLTVTSSRFYGHLSKGSVIYLMSSSAEISSSYIYSNKSPGIKLVMSKSTLESSEIRNQACASGCSVLASLQSQVYIIKSNLHDGNSTDGGGAIYSSQSSIYIQSSSLSRLFSELGGSIYATYGSSIDIKDSQFISSSSSLGGIIYAHQASISIANSQFSSFTGSGIYGTLLTSLEINSSKFIEGSGIMGGCVYCLNCDLISIKDCSFSENQVTSSGGALYLVSDYESGKKSTCTISGCLFQSNIGEEGGAVYAKDINLEISSSKFVENEASYSSLEAKSYGQAGGVYMSCSKADYCDFQIISSNFTQNSATSGGAMYFDNKEPKFTDNIYISNTATYGRDVASYPIKLMVVQEDGTLADNSNTTNEIPTSTLNLNDVASGQKNAKPLLVALVDAFGQIVSSDSESSGDIEPSSSVIVDGIIKVDAVDGIFNFSSYSVSAQPGTIAQIKVFSSGIDTSKDLALSQSLYINAQMRNCQIGEVKAGKLCKVCSEGYYSLDPSSTVCLACPAAAKCYGGYRMSPKPGYWRDNPYTDKFWKCPNPSACLGSPDGQNITYTGACRKGYKGNKCQSCVKNYSRSINSKCKECPSLAINILILTAVFCLFIIIAFLLVKSTIKSALKPTALAPVYLKIFLNYLQFITVASTFDLNWPSEIIELFYVQNGVDYVYQQVYSFECLLGEDSRGDVYFKTLILTAVFPLIAFVIALAVWTIIKILKRSLKNFWDDYISTCIIILFLIHPTLVKKLAGSLNCTEINPGEYWLKEDLGIRCWETTHVVYVVVVAIPALFVWGILFPAVCLANIVKQRNILNEMNVKLRYGFLFNGFMPKHYYWEFIILYSKLLLVCTSVFLTTVDVKVQALIAAILLSLFWYLQFENKPYVEDSLNNTELTAKTVCIITIYSGLFYLTDTLNDTSVIILLFFIFAANIYFVVYWLIKLFKVSIQPIYNTIKTLVRGNKVMPISESDSGSTNKLEDSQNSKKLNRLENFSISSNDDLEFIRAPDASLAQDSENITEQFSENTLIESVLNHNKQHGVAFGESASGMNLSSDQEDLNYKELVNYSNISMDSLPKLRNFEGTKK